MEDDNDQVSGRTGDVSIAKEQDIPYPIIPLFSFTNILTGPGISVKWLFAPFHGAS